MKKVKETTWKFKAECRDAEGYIVSLAEGRADRVEVEIKIDGRPCETKVEELRFRY